MRFFNAHFFAWLAIALLAPLFAFADTASPTTPDQRAALEAQLQDIQSQIKQNQSNLAQLQTQRTSLERDVAILDSKIQAAQLAIKQRNLIIEGLKENIVEKQQGIDDLDTKVAGGQEALAQILRETHQIDDMSLADLALGGDINDLFQEIDDFQTIQKALGTSFQIMATQRADLSARKDALEEQQQEEQDLLQIQVLQQEQLKSTESQKQDLITEAKGQESNYQKIIADKQQTAQQIENALFALRDTKAVSFGDMYSYAREASVKTGVAPAFILAILSQESDLGQNIGSCYVTDLQTGDGVSKNTGDMYQQVMKAPRDTTPFQQITTNFGMNWATTPVSCPLGKHYTSSRGYGGAMGPAQFIPSTWELYSDRIAAASGQTSPNPWDPRTATFATAIYMMDLGADQQTWQSERNAALHYFAGSHWSNPNYSFYGDQVMAKVDQFQSQINILGNS